MTVKDDLLNTNRPLSDKIGSNVWGWDTKRETVECVHEAQLMGLKYLRYPYIISRTVTTYAGAADTWRYGLKAILDAGIVPIVDFYASNNDAIPNGLVPDDTVSYFKTTIEDVIKDNKGKGIVWESWNEAIGNFWSKTPSTSEVMKQITDMHKFIADTVKTNDPDSAFIGPSLDTKQANYTDGIYTENGGELYSYLKAYKDAGSFDIVDAVSIHPYSLVHNNGGNPEVFIKELSTYGDLSGNKPLIPTEFEYPVKMDDPRNRWQTVFSLHDARVKTLRQVLLMDMLGCPTILVDTFGSTVTNVVSNISVGGTNLLTGTGSHTVTGAMTNGYLSNETTDDLLTLLKGLEGQTVTISVDYKYSGFVAGGAKNRIGWEIAITADSTSWPGVWYYPNNDSGSGRMSSTFVVPQNITSIDEGCGYIQFSGSGTGVLSHFKLEKGNKATDWSPAPEDSASQAHSDTSLLNNIKLDGLEDGTSEGIGGKLSSVGEALTSFMTRIKGYTFKERLTTTSYNAQGVIDDLYALKYTKEGSSDLMVYWSPIPNRYGVVATSPNVTHKLSFQDMPQIKAI